MKRLLHWNNRFRDEAPFMYRLWLVGTALLVIALLAQLIGW